MHNMDWDNLRYVLAVAEHGSVSAAARELGVNHATVIRRVAAFEDSFGGEVFDKAATGYRLLPDRKAVLEAMRDVESSVYSVRRLMTGGSASLRGVVRVASTDTLCQLVLPRIVSKLNTRFAEIKIDLYSSNAHVDFARMQADVFVRPALSLPPDMAGEQAASLRFGAYSTTDARNCWLGLNGPLANSGPAAWLQKTVPPEQISGGSDSFLVLRQMAETGAGIAILPTFVARGSTVLHRLVDRMPAFAVPVWVGSHRDLRDTRRISATRTHIIRELARDDNFNDATTGE